MEFILSNFEREEFTSYYDTGLIHKVIGLINSGKEAEVYLASGSKGLVAIKVFKERNERSFKNRTDYDMALVRSTSRAARALKNKSEFGHQVAEGIWRGREVGYLERLAMAGADVPKVLGVGENSFVMEFIGNETGAAPRLIDARQKISDPERCFQLVLKNLEIFLDCDLVHGDLSPYNILFTELQNIVIIDVPQAVEIMRSRQAKELFERDLRNICVFFRKLGVHCDEYSIGESLWNKNWRTQVVR